MVKTWAANITPLLEEACYREYYLEAPVFRQQKADRIKSMRGKAQSIGVWALYDRMRQFYKLGERIQGYNFSHSGDYVLCAVCTEQENADAKVCVGCDVEQIRSFRLDMAKRFFCKSEYQSIMEEQEAMRQKVFCRYWVLKESFMKATGKGMAMALNSFEIQLGSPSVLLRQPKEFPETFYYMESELGDGAYRIAVCSTDEEIDTEVKEVQLLGL